MFEAVDLVRGFSKRHCRDAKANLNLASQVLEDRPSFCDRAATAIGKTLETSDHLGLTRVPTLVYKPHRAFSFQAIPKIAIAQASTGATKNPGISLGRSCE